MVALTAVVSVWFWTFRQIEKAGAARAHNFLAINGANDLLSELVDGETGERGYILTGDKAYLSPYMAVRRSIGGHLNALRQMTLSRGAENHLDAMAPLIEAKLDELSDVIGMRRRHDLPAALKVVYGGQGRRLMDLIRTEMSGFIQIEESTMALHDGEFQSEMRRLFSIIVISSLFVLLLALFFVYLIDREARLQKARVIAEELSKFKTNLVSVVSHEFGNALAIIKTCNFLLDEKLPEAWFTENKYLFEMIDSNIEGLLQATKNLLQMGRLEAGKLAINFAPADAAGILKSVLQRMEMLCKKQELDASLNLPDGLERVRADADSLTLVVSNLLSNAIKYTPKGGRVVLGIIPESARPGYYRIFVQDTGIGVSEEDRVKILGGHFRSESGKAMTAKGYGVGLSLAQQIVEAHDSTIEIEGGPGKGSRFSFLLPVMKQTALSRLIRS